MVGMQDEDHIHGARRHRRRRLAGEHMQKILGGRTFPLPEQVDDFFVGGVAGEVGDAVAAVIELSGLPIDGTNTGVDRDDVFQASLELYSHRLLRPAPLYFHSSSGTSPQGIRLPPQTENRQASFLASACAICNQRGGGERVPPSAAAQSATWSQAVNS